MNISDVLNQINVPHTLKGKGEFDSLGLIGHAPGIKLCSFIESSKYLDSVSEDISVLLVTESIADEISGTDICIVENPRRTFFEMHNFLSDSEDYRIETYRTVIDDSSVISPLASISKTNVSIGRNCVIEEFVSIKANVSIGDNVIIRAGSIIGGEGFEMKRNQQNNLFGVKHVGKVTIADNVEIQYNTCIDKAIYPWDETYIGDSSKLNNLIHIAHAVKIGKNTMITANAIISGRTILGDNVWVGLGATIRNGIVIGDDARVNMGAVVTQSVKTGESVSGNFAVEHSKFINNLKLISK